MMLCLLLAVAWPSAQVVAVATPASAPALMGQPAKLKKPVETRMHQINLQLGRRTFQKYAISNDGRELYLTSPKNEWEAAKGAKRDKAVKEADKWWKTVCQNKDHGCLVVVLDEHSTALVTPKEWKGSPVPYNDKQKR